MAKKPIYCLRIKVKRDDERMCAYVRALEPDGIFEKMEQIGLAIYSFKQSFDYGPGSPVLNVFEDGEVTKDELRTAETLARLDLELDVLNNIDLLILLLGITARFHSDREGDADLDKYVADQNWKMVLNSTDASDPRNLTLCFDINGFYISEIREKWKVESATAPGSSEPMRNEPESPVGPPRPHDEIPSEG